MLAVEIGAGFRLELPRAPDIRAALADVYGEENDTPFLLPLNRLLGFVGAHEWHKKAWTFPHWAADTCAFRRLFPFARRVSRPADAGGTAAVFSDGFDIGTGSGVLAALLVKRGLRQITATDNNPRMKIPQLACQQLFLIRTETFIREILVIWIRRRE